MVCDVLWSFSPSLVASVRPSARPALQIHLLRGHKNDITAFDYSRDGKYVATADSDGNVRVVFRASLGKGQQLRFHQINIARDFPSALAFSPDGKYLCVALSLSRRLAFYQLHSKVANKPELRATIESGQETEISKVVFTAFKL